MVKFFHADQRSVSHWWYLWKLDFSHSAIPHTHTHTNIYSITSMGNRLFRSSSLVHSLVWPYFMSSVKRTLSHRSLNHPTPTHSEASCEQHAVYVYVFERGECIFGWIVHYARSPQSEWACACTRVCLGVLRVHKILLPLVGVTKQFH